MSAIVTDNLSWFTDLHGRPLNNGNVWIGSPNTDPRQNPVAAFYDAALTLPAAQPLKTFNGRLMYAGAPANFYTNDTYSIYIEDQACQKVEYLPSVTPTGAASGSSAIGFIQAGAGAVARTVQAKLRERVSVLDFGADPTGNADSTAAIQAAMNAYPNGVTIYFPAGTYLFSTVATAAPIALEGDGNHATILKTSNLTNNAITFTGPGWHVRNIGFASTANRTAGANLYANGARYGSIRGVSLTQFYIGFDIDNCVGITIDEVDALNGTPAGTAANGAIIRVGQTAYCGNINITNLIADVDNAGAQPSTGITIGYVDVMRLDGCLIIHHTDCVYIRPGAGQFTSLLSIDNCCLDTATNGLHVAPTGGAYVTRSTVSNTWCGAHSQYGVFLNGLNSSQINSLSFNNVRAHGNSIGFNAVGASVMEVNCDSCYAAGNTGNGLQLTQGANVNFLNGALGSYDIFGGNGSSGCAVDATSTGSLINTLLNNNTVGTLNNQNPNGFVTQGNTPYAWTAATPVVTAQTGTITTATATLRYQLIGKTCVFSATVTITNNGTGAGYVNMTLPANAAAAEQVAVGRANGVSGKMLQGTIDGGTNNCHIYNYDNTYPGSNGEIMYMSGTYETE